MNTPEVRFTRAADAVAWLKMQGWQISPAGFSRHFKARRIPKDADGTFRGSALLAFASTHLTPVARVEDKESRGAVLAKASADADLKSVRAERERLRLAREQGKLMPISRHEDELAARALFFRREITGFVLRKGSELIEVVHGQEGDLDALVSWWENATADWMDAWSRDGMFALEEEQDADLGEIEDEDPIY